MWRGISKIPRGRGSLEFENIQLGQCKAEKVLKRQGKPKICCSDTRHYL